MMLRLYEETMACLGLLISHQNKHDRLLKSVIFRLSLGVVKRPHM